MTTNTTPQLLRKHMCQRHRGFKSQMPTSSQALILLNSELDSSLGICSTRVRRAVTSTAGLMLSSLAISVSQGQDTINLTPTPINGFCNTVSSLKDSGTLTVAAPTPLNSTTRQNDNQQGDCFQKDGVWLPRSSCSNNPSLKSTQLLSDSVQYRSLGRAGGSYHYRQPLILSSRHYPSPITHDRCPQSVATSRDHSEEVWPVLEVRKSQHFYRPLQSLHVSTSPGEALVASHSNPRQDVATSEPAPIATQATFNPINRRLIQRLRELGFRSRSSNTKGQNRNVSNGNGGGCEDETQQQHNEGSKKKLSISVGPVYGKGEKSPGEEATLFVAPGAGDKLKEVSTIPLLTSLLQPNIETNGHGQWSRKKLHSKKDEAESASNHQYLQDGGEENLEKDERADKEIDAAEREKVDQLVANLQAGMRQRKYKPPSIRMRKELPEKRPLTVCFGCGSNVHISHEEIKRELELQYPDVSIVSLQFDPVSVNVGDPSTRNRWIVSLSKHSDCHTMIKGGVLLTGSDRVRVQPLDDVMKEEHNAYKLHQYVQDAKSKVSLMKDDNPRKSKRSKHKVKPRKKKVTVK